MAYVDSLNLLREFIYISDRATGEGHSSQLVVEMLGKILIYSG